MNSSPNRQDDKNYYIISDYYMGGDVQAHVVDVVVVDVVGATIFWTARKMVFGLGEWWSFSWWLSYDTMPFEMMIKIFSREIQPVLMQSMNGFTQHFSAAGFDACGDDLSKSLEGIHWSTKKGYIFVGKPWSSYST